MERNKKDHSIASQDSPNSDCFFCQLSQDTSLLENVCVYEDKMFLVTHQLNNGGSTFLGRLFIQTKRHVEALSDMDSSEAERLGLLINLLSKMLKASTGAPWTYCECFMEAFRHVHLILTARYPDLPKQYIRLGITEWPNAPRGDKADVMKFSAKLRSEFAVLQNA
jgi:histidine triad (HIT) family protein